MCTNLPQKMKKNNETLRIQARIWMQVLSRKLVISYTWRSWDADRNSEVASSLVSELKQELGKSVKGLDDIEETVRPVVQNVSLNCSAGEADDL